MSRDQLHLGRSWFVLTTAPAREAEAIRALSRRGYHVVRPTEQVWRRIGGRGERKPVEIGLTPRYLFLRSNGWPNMYALSQVYGRDGNRLVTGYLSVDGLPAIVSDAVFDALMSASTVGLTPMHRSLKPGDLVRHPTLHDIVGRLIEVDPKLRRYRAEFDMLGGVREVTIHDHKVEAA
jgi:transcription antitermination factor NusG